MAKSSQTHRLVSLWLPLRVVHEIDRVTKVSRSEYVSRVLRRHLTATARPATGRTDGYTKRRNLR